MEQPNYLELKNQGYQIPELQVKPAPIVFVQLQGTDICGDFRCTCGEIEHLDSDFLFYWQCKCGKVYQVGCYLTLTELVK